MAVRGEESATMLPKTGPDPFAVRLRELESVQGLTREEPEVPFPVIGRRSLQLQSNLEQEHQPMCVALVAVLTDDARQV
jgi:hypothetical protein